MTLPDNVIAADHDQFEVIKKLTDENSELKARCEAYEKRIRQMEDCSERSYMRGRIDGLEFSIRCNGVSGDSVKHA